MSYLLYVCVLYMFFFFRHKTAYEMCISDWSSDVCSSDLVQNRNNRIAQCRRSHLAPQIGAATTLGEYLRHRRLDPRRARLVAARMAQQHRERQDHRQRIGDALARDVGRAAVDGLIQPLLAFAERSRCKQPDRPDAHRRLIGQYVAKEVAGDDDVELARIADKLHRDRKSTRLNSSH